MTAYHMQRLVHVGINPNVIFPATRREAIEKYFNTVATDWFRYGSQNYVLYTNAELDALTQGLTQLPGMQGAFVFATEISPFALGGMMPSQFWDWLNKPRW
ncbi:MAG TPA: hypothetical protein VJO35_12205 [Terriglobales bacterium]|nr:hypothetical protein [Terriglobales bacterium]